MGISSYFYKCGHKANELYDLILLEGTILVLIEAEMVAPVLFVSTKSIINSSCLSKCSNASTGPVCIRITVKDGGEALS